MYLLVGMEAWALHMLTTHRAKLFLTSIALSGSLRPVKTELNSQPPSPISFSYRLSVAGISSLLSVHLQSITPLHADLTGTTICSAQSRHDQRLEWEVVCRQYLLLSKRGHSCSFGLSFILGPLSTLDTGLPLAKVLEKLCLAARSSCGRQRVLVCVFIRKWVVKVTVVTKPLAILGPWARKQPHFLQSNKSEVLAAPSSITHGFLLQIAFLVQGYEANDDIQSRSSRTKQDTVDKYVSKVSKYRVLIAVPGEEAWCS